MVGLPRLKGLSVQYTHIRRELVPLLRRQVVRVVQLEPVLGEVDGDEAQGWVNAGGAPAAPRDQDDEQE